MAGNNLGVRPTSWLERQQDRHGVLVLVLASVFAVYSSVEKCPFSFDDLPLIVTNPYLRDWQHLFTVLGAGRAARGFTFMLDYALWGLDSASFHRTNILLHILSGILFYLLLFQLFGSKRLPFLAAFIFVYHPIQSEAVIGIAHRKELLAMSFLCLSYLSYLRWGQRSWGLGLSLIAYLLALLSKQVALVLPALLLAQELILPRTQLSRPRRFLPILPYFLLPALAFLLKFQDFRLFGRFQPVDFTEARYGQILSTSLQSFPTYLRLAFFPMHLTVDYYLPLVRSPWSLGPALGVVALASLVLLILLLARRKPILSFGLAWFLISLAPALNLVPANAFLAERYLYLPSAGICLVLAGLLEELVVRPEPILSGRAEAWVQAFLLFLLVACFFGFNPLPYLRMIAPPQDLNGSVEPARALIASALLSAALFTAAAAGLEARRRRGGMLARSLALRFVAIWMIFALLFLADVSLARFLATGRVALPEIHVTQAYSGFFHWLQQEARPGPRGLVYYFPTGSLATELFNLAVFWVAGDSVWVMLFFGLARRFRRQAPNGGVVFTLIFVLLTLMAWIQINYRIKDWGHEVSLWQATVRENPRSVIGWNNLGRAYSIREKWPQAETALARAFALDPTRSDTAMNLGILQFRLGHLPEARQDFEQAVELSPLNVPARLNLANCLAAEGNSTEAIKQYDGVLRLDPNSAHAHFNLAALYHRLKQDPPALYHLRQALMIDPGNPKALELMREIRAGAAKSSPSAP
jgi:protein O-mannosyl-transferase